jgi:prepilin-type N-terminal cleavage/methylation domain-containing protein
MTQIRKVKFKRNEKGFTLIEVVISIVLLGLIAAALATGLSTASKVLLQNDTRQTAKNLAETQMEFIKGITFDPLATTYDTSAITHPIEYTPSNVVYSGKTPVTINGITYFDTTINKDKRDSSIQLIVVTITGPGTISYTLEGYKVK